jgi:hypothetical protein
VYRGSGYDVLDTTLIPERSMDQQRDFLNNQYDFPSKPRNQWEIGISGGLFNVSGDVRTKMPWNAKNGGQTLGFGVHFVKLGVILSLLVYNIYMVELLVLTGNPQLVILDTTGNPWNIRGYGAKPVFYNYKTTIDELSFQLVASLNNIKFHKASNKASIYALAGIGGTLYDTWVDALKGSSKI